MKFFKFFLTFFLFAPFCFSQSSEKILKNAIYFGMKENPQKFYFNDEINLKDKGFLFKLKEKIEKEKEIKIEKTERSIIGSISGYVKNNEDIPLEGIELYLFPKDFIYPLNEINIHYFESYYAKTDSSGFYTLSFENEGSYVLFASDPQNFYLSEYYDDKFSFEEAYVFSLKAGDNLKNINFNLQKSASISGKVFDLKTGEGVWGIYIYISNLNAGFDPISPNFYYSITDDNGNYKISGLFPGVYEIYAMDFGNFYGEDKYFEDIKINDSEDITGIDFYLNPTTTGIKGKVFLPSGNPAKDAWVYVSSFSFLDPEDSYWTYTNSKGEYRVGTKANNYLIQGGTFDDTTLPTYYPGVRNIKDAEKVEVEENKIVEDINFQLLPAGFIEGKVLSYTSEPLASIYVQVYDKMGVFVNYSKTDEEGSFKIGGLDEGKYHLFAWDPEGNYSSQWYQNKKSLNEADPVNVKRGEVTSDILFKLNKAGKIAGYVVDLQNLKPLKDIFIIAYDENYYYESYSTSAEDGYFELKGLKTGNYFIFGYDLNGEYIPTYYDATTDQSLATPIYVQEGEEINITFKMIRGGKIKGRVFSNTNMPLNSAYVTAFDLNGNWSGFSYTGEDGSYSIGGLLKGTYILYAQDGTGKYAPKWYNNADSPNEATKINVNLGSTIENINFYLPPAGSISGTVLDLDGNPLSYIVLFAEKIEGSNFFSFDTQWASTDENGNYKIIGLGTGNYRVGILFPNGRVFYYDGTYDVEKAKPVPVVQGEETKNINFQISYTAGAISGKVVDSSNSNPIPFAFVIVYDEFGIPAYFGLTDEDGNYNISFVEPGRYKVSAWAEGYKEEWWKEKKSFKEGDWVFVNENQNVTGIDFTLEKSL